MGRFPQLTLVLALAITSTDPSAAQTVEDLDHLWHQTIDALKAGSSDAAAESFGRFNQELRLYWSKPENRDWKSRYLAGSLYCQFSQSRKAGALILEELLHDSRDLSDKGKAELTRLLKACTNTTRAASEEERPEPPTDIISASSHYQVPGIHSATKGGYISTGREVSGVAVSPLPAAELLARLVPLSEPQKALDAALARLPGTKGAIVNHFAITTTGDVSQAKRIGNCLVSYADTMKEQFEIGPANYMVTVYSAEWNRQVYEYARRLHGLALPAGVVAYSVAEDMSLSGSDCESMAHELVHLLIKPRFPVSPAWLEEGLASEVAVASPERGRFEFRPSWRDRTLRDNWGQRPSVATLLDLSWSDFTARNQSDLIRAAAVQAMAAVFIRYLSEKAKLTDVYLEVRDHLFGADLPQVRSYRQVIEEKLGQNLEEVDTDFVKWFQKQNLDDSNSGENTRRGNASTGPCKASNPMEQKAQEPCVPVAPTQKNP